MSPTGGPGPDRLADHLSAIGYPVRLELLEILRYPRTLGEIRVAPQRVRGGGPGRPAARQTVQHHLDKLVETGLLRVSKVERGGKVVPQYVVNVQKLYAMTEELRRLATRPALSPEMDATGTLSEKPTATPTEGPRLVLAHGAYEGRSFSLDAKASSEGRWVIGRKRGLAVCLDYDPYVSLENAALTLAEGGYLLTDLRTSKNGTSVNWVPLPRGGSRALRPGDMVGVGRSLLSFVR